MALLGRVLVEALMLDHGREEVQRQLASPFSFQCLGYVLGMHWRERPRAPLRRGLAPVEGDLGLAAPARGRPGEARQRRQLAALRRLDIEARRLEAADVEAFIGRERARSRRYGGRMVRVSAGPPTVGASRSGS